MLISKKTFGLDELAEPPAVAAAADPTGRGTSPAPLTSPQSWILMRPLVLPFSEPSFSILRINSCPCTTPPNTTCFPSSQLVFAVVMKNWEPLVLGPALAIDRR